MQGFVDSDEVLALAIASDTRSTSYPDVPTVVEEGMPDLVSGATQGLYLQTRTPDDSVTTISDAVSVVLEDPETRAAATP